MSVALENRGLRLDAVQAAEQGVLRGPVHDEFLRDETLPEIFAASVTGRDDHPALIHDGRVYTYGEVLAAARVLTRGLRRRGIGPGDVVGLWMTRGAELLIAQIGITGSGAAWLPFDADAPVERIARCLDDSHAKGLLTDAAGLERLSGFRHPVFTSTGLADPSDESPVPARPVGLTPSHPAYLIYTSGSTGTPKGIVITHANICHFLRAANAVYGFNARDIVFQGASAAFDLSMEEIWITYLVGATLFVATPAIMGDVERLPEVLDANGVTVLDTVPTLLSMLPRPVPSLRMILLGGEALPALLVERWAKAGCRLLNTYGPTETTVAATVAEMQPGKLVTIGSPLPNYTAYVVDESLRLLPPGVQGELLIGGPGVAPGYLQRPELTTEKFIPNPFPSKGRDPILYRSGDAVSLTQDGELLFHGRIDDQVKIRGFRVELGEIESRLSHLPGVASAAVVLRQDDGVDRLIAFMVSQGGFKLDKAVLRAALREQLPPYMIPNHFEVVHALPRLPSGKIDRKTLKTLELSAREPDSEQEPARNSTEVVLLAAARRVLGNQALPFDADFFADLGGHSLLAARFVSAVRETPVLASITLQDVYQRRTLRAISDHLIATTGGADAASVARDLSFEPPPLMRRFWCGLAQAVALVFILSLVTLQWLGLFIATVFTVDAETGPLQEMAILFAVYIATTLGVKALVVALKWLVIGRTKPGRYPLWGVYYFRLWLVQRLIQTTTVKFLQNSPLMRVYLRLLGAKVGRDAMISDFEAGAIDLLSIGEGASLGPKTRFANVEVIGNEVVVGRIEVGAHAGIGASCTLPHGCRIGEGAELGDLTAVPPDGVIGAYERWDGSPGRKVGDVDRAHLPELARASFARRAAHGTVYALAYVLMQLLGLLPVFPAFYVLYNLDAFVAGAPEPSISWGLLPFLAWPTAIVLILVTIAVIVALRWILLPRRIASGTYSIHSNFYLRKWVLGLAAEVTLETLSSLYATVFMRGWYRLLGARIGKGSEISTNIAGRYDLINIGADNFVGDETVLGDEEIHRGWVTLKELKTGDRVFMGNESVVSAGSRIGDGALVGVKSKLPASSELGAGEVCFGSPAMVLPTRHKVDLGSEWTYRPPAWRLVVRTLFEAAHTSLPTALMITAGYMAADLLETPLIEGQWGISVGIFLAAGVVIAMVLALVAVAAKWLMIGTYQPTMKPMWSFWAMRTEAVAVLYAGLAGKSSIEFFRGTPMLPWILRLFGTKIGQGVWMDLTDLTEFDCITIGDFSTLNMSAALQTHLYEDRVMKVGRIELGRGVHVGWSATVLYDTRVGDYARLSPLTIVMKGETIPANSAWEGAPAVPASVPREELPEQPVSPELPTTQAVPA